MRSRSCKGDPKHAAQIRVLVPRVQREPGSIAQERARTATTVDAWSIVSRYGAACTNRPG